MLVTSHLEFRQRLLAETRDVMSPQFPLIPRSLEIVIPSLSFFQNEWFNFWTTYRRDRGLINFNNTFCDLVAGIAVAEANWCAGHLTQQTGRDATIAMFEARVDIHTRPFMGIDPCRHCNTLFAYTVDNHNYDLAFWEPQQNEKQFIYAPIASALNALDLYDVLL